MGESLIESGILAEMQKLTHQMGHLLTLWEGNHTGTLVVPVISPVPATGSEPAQQGAMGIPGATRPEVRLGTGQFPLTVWREGQWDVTQDHTPVLATSYDCLANGTIQLGVSLADTAAYPLVTWDDGLTWAALNQATALATGTWNLFTIPVARSDAWNLAWSAATTLAVIRVFFIPG